VSFRVDATAYGRFMGRWSEPLAATFADFAEVEAGQSALDVGCGPGVLTAELVRRLGAGAVAAVDPSPPFVTAARERLPGVAVARAGAERLPFADRTFDRVLAQLVVPFLARPTVGLVEMVRVVRPGGLVAACAWDHAGGGSPLSLFWRAVADLDPSAHDESQGAGTAEGQLASMLTAARLREVRAGRLTLRLGFDDFDDWWSPFALGVGPAGDYVAGLDTPHRERLRRHCAGLLPDGSFSIEATAWAAAGRR
jgi:SAM-dependent methyltransferase